MISSDRVSSKSEPMSIADVLITVRPTLGGEARDMFDQLGSASERLPWAPERRGVKREPLDDEIRIAVLRRDDFTCQWCGPVAANQRKPIVQVDHIVPWSAGGSDHPVNLRALCVPCNRERSNRLTDAGYARQQLPIVRRCQRCEQNDDSWDLSVMAFCLCCNRTAPSPYELLGGPIPASGVPGAPAVEIPGQQDRERPVRIIERGQARAARKAEQ